MNRLLLLFLCVFILSIPTIIYANPTNEVSLFKNFYDMVNNPKESSNPAIIDYSVEIIKNAPDSLESMYVFSLLTRISTNDDRINNKYYELKDKYYNDLDNTDVNMPEKLVLIFLLNTGIDINSDNDMANNVNKFKESLNKIKDFCNNKDYAALANILLMFDLEKQELYFKELKTNFPNHKSLPLAELVIINSLYSKKEYNKCINECEIYVNKYGKILSPFGWKLIMDCYNLMIYNYLALKDYENAIKYFKIIENEAPNYDNIKQLKAKINKYNK